MGWHRIFTLLVLGVGSATQAQFRPTDLVIDEFGEPVSISLPASRETREVNQTGIGLWSIDRQISLDDANIRARGVYGTEDSALAVNVTGATPVPQAGISLLSLSFAGHYELSAPFNLPELGYDALAIDFRSMDSWLGYVPRVDAFLRTTQQASLFFSSQYDLPLNDSPFTLLFPLDSFTDRGAGLGDDFNDVVSIWFRVYSVYLTGAAPDMTFSMEIDRIRFTTLAVPEPTALALLPTAVLAASSRRRV